MSNATPLQDAQWRAMEAVNKLVECDASWEDRHDAIGRVRAHLEARLEQTIGDEYICAEHNLPYGATRGCAACIAREEFLREHIVVAVVGDNADLL